VRRTRLIGAGVAACALLASLAVAAPAQITLAVQPTIIRSTSDRMTIFGSVSGGDAGKKVTIQFKACGLQPIQFRDAFETTTRAGGGFSLEELRPFNLGVSGVYRAVSGGEVSAEIRVQQRAAVYMMPLSGGRFQVWGRRESVILASLRAAPAFRAEARCLDHAATARLDRKLRRKLLSAVSPSRPQGDATPGRLAALADAPLLPRRLRPNLPDVKQR
jgi:hypothetical protein